MEDFFNTLDLDTQVELIQEFCKGSKIKAVTQLANIYPIDKDLPLYQHPSVTLLQKLQKEFCPETIRRRVF